MARLSTLSSLILALATVPAATALAFAPETSAAPKAPAVAKPVTPSAAKAPAPEAKPKPATPEKPQPADPAAPAVQSLPPAPVFCGTFTCFHFRTKLGLEEPDARASFAMDVINKYLGGAVGKVATEPRGKSVRLTLNGDLLAVVTPADAAAEKQKTPALLAAKWSKQVSQAFEASKARR